MADSPPPHNPTKDLKDARLKAKFFQKGKLYLSLYLLVLPTVLSLLVFSYYPKFDVVIMSMFRWQPPVIKEFVGLQNFIEVFGDPVFWNSFRLVGILLIANLLKLWPGIFAAIALHRLASDRLRYYFQVAFVVPMIIPGMVFLLIWKSFYDPEFGIVNRLLNFTGGMGFLNWLDGAMPALAKGLSPVMGGFVSPVFGGLAGLIFTGVAIMAMANRKERDAARWRDFGLVIGGSLIVPLFRAFGALNHAAGWVVLLILVVGWMVYLARTMGRGWIAWPLLTLAGTVIFAEQLWRLPLVFALSIGIFEWVRSQRDFFFGQPIILRVGLGLVAVGVLLVLLGGIWTQPIGQFAEGKPAWLGNPDLVIPAILFWGFPWVGTVGVLIYLSGLQAISQDVYEAAKLDGVSPLGMIFRIELPLIMTQVRINLIFLTISTLTSYELFLILLGPGGGPGNKGVVPGLYMFSQAFGEGRFGFACALGMVMFALILLITIIYQKYVKVDK